MGDIVFLILAIVLMVVGLVGIVLPFVPGIPLVWLGFFIFAAITGFKTISLVAVLIFLALTVAVTALDFLAPIWGAKKYQASKWGMIGSFFGTIIGVFTMGLWGVIIGPFIGSFIGELIAGQGRHQAFKSALGTFLGFILSTALRLIVALIMLGYLIAAL